MKKLMLCLALALVLVLGFIPQSFAGTTDNATLTNECTCTALCEADNADQDCPVCGEENADLSGCNGSATKTSSEDSSSSEDSQNTADSSDKNSSNIKSVKGQSKTMDTDTGSILIMNRVPGTSDEATKSKATSFTISLKSATDEAIGDVTLTYCIDPSKYATGDNVKTETLSLGKSETFTYEIADYAWLRIDNIPVGTTYAVDCNKEALFTDALLNYYYGVTHGEPNNREGTVSSGESKPICFINIYEGEYGKLSLTNNINNAPDSDQAYTFEITLSIHKDTLDVDGSEAENELVLLLYDVCYAMYQRYGAQVDGFSTLSPWLDYEVEWSEDLKILTDLLDPLKRLHSDGFIVSYPGGTQKTYHDLDSYDGEVTFSVSLKSGESISITGLPYFEGKTVTLMDGNGTIDTTIKTQAVSYTIKQVKAAGDDYSTKITAPDGSVAEGTEISNVITGGANLIAFESTYADEDGDQSGGTSSSSGGSGKANSSSNTKPATGESDNLALLAAILILGAAGLGSAAIRRKKS